MHNIVLHVLLGKQHVVTLDNKRYLTVYGQCSHMRVLPAAELAPAHSSSPFTRFRTLLAVTPALLLLNDHALHAPPTLMCWRLPHAVQQDCCP